MMKAYDVGAAMVAAECLPMTEDQSEIFIRMSMMGNQDIVVTSEMNPGMGFRIMEQRVKAAGIVAENRVLLFFSLLCDRPGIVVMYAAAIKWMAEQKRVGKVVVWNDVAQAFPMGFPSERALHDIWDRQKVHDGKGGDNSLDRAEAWV